VSADPSPGDPADPLADVLQRFGSAKRPDRPPARERPPGAGDDVVEAVGKLSEAMESMEHARGLLYAFHRQSGRTDLLLQDAVERLRQAGEGQVADRVDEVLVGRDIFPGIWTYQLVENYDENYAEVFRAVEEAARQHLVGGVPHIYEAEMKAREQGFTGSG
jgi:hypothetical protein